MSQEKKRKGTARKSIIRPKTARPKAARPKTVRPKTVRPKTVRPKILVILGPTSSGKSDLAVVLAKKFNGEIISADSRQVYKGLDLGSGKITKREMSGIPHHLLDVASPKKIFSVADFQKIADKKIGTVLSRGKLPIVAGGTGFYIQSIVDGVVFPEIAHNRALRKNLEKLTTEKLQKILQRIDFARSKKIDKNNRVRLIRAIEIAKSIGHVPKPKLTPKYDALQIGLLWEGGELRKRINERLRGRIKKGLINEVKNLHKNGVTWKRLHALGLEYRYVSLFLQNKISREKMISELENKIYQYTKRQMTWFKRDKRIKWLKISKPHFQKSRATKSSNLKINEVRKIVENFCGSTRT